MSKKISSKDLRDLVLETRDKSMAKPITNGQLRNMIIEAMNDADPLPKMLPDEDEASEASER